jgi:type II secretory pathway predicted ATPase ExeA
MYEKFYNLKEKPFAILPDPEFIFWGQAHSLAFSILDYGVQNKCAFTVITGEIGCGKTTLVRHLLNKITEELTVGIITNTQEGMGSLLHWVLMAFDQPVEDKPYVQLYNQLNDFLIDQYAKNKRVILIVDEAQNFGLKALEELRMISNINVDNDLLLQLILVGQPQLKDLLQRPELVQFSQRIAADFHLQPLKEDEIMDYIKHRLSVAGREEPLFEDETIPRIKEASRGIPRLINIICDTTLVYGFSMSAKTINEEIVCDVIRDKANFGVFSYNAPKSTEEAMAKEKEEQKEKERERLRKEANAIYGGSQDGERPALIVNDPKIAELLISKLMAD